MLTTPASSPPDMLTNEICLSLPVCHYLTGFNRFQVLHDTAANLLRVGRLVREAASKGSQVVALPVSDLYQHKHTDSSSSVDG